MVAGTIFLLAQLAVIAVWTCLYQRRRKLRQFDACSLSSQITVKAGSRTDSMCKLYDSGYARHF